MSPKFDINRISQFLSNTLELIAEPLVSPLVDDHVSIKTGEYNSVFKLAIPGFGKEDVRLTKKGDKLLIYVKDKLVKSLFLTKSVDKENIKTTIKNGILEIDFSKAFETEEEEISIN